MPRRSGSAIGSGHGARLLRRAPAEERPDVAHGLADALAVLDQGEAHEALAVLAKAKPGETATLASRSSSLLNSSEPSAR